jgi:hypothetical protein
MDCFPLPGKKKACRLFWISVRRVLTRSDGVRAFVARVALKETTVQRE